MNELMSYVSSFTTSFNTRNTAVLKRLFSSNFDNNKKLPNLQRKNFLQQIQNMDIQSYCDSKCQDSTIANMVASHISSLISYNQNDYESSKNVR
jgi:hypothetical protein